MQNVKSKTNTNLVKNENVSNKCISDMDEGWYTVLILQILSYKTLHYSYIALGQTEVKNYGVYQWPGNCYR